MQPERSQNERTENPLLQILEHGDFRYCLDSAPRKVFSGGMIQVEGWCFAQGSNLPPPCLLRIEEMENISLFEVHPRRMIREDVGKVFPDEVSSSYSGFLFEFPILRKARYRASLFAKSRDDALLLLDTREFLAIPPHASSSGLAFPPPTAEDYRMHLDVPQNRLSLRREFSVHGWLIRRDGQAIDGFRARVGERHFSLSSGLRRPDVFEHFQGRSFSMNCGFEGKVELPDLPFDVVFEVCYRGIWIELQSIRIGREGTLSSLSGILRKSFTEDLREFPKLSLRKRLQINLLDAYSPHFYGNFQQHAPREILQEALPGPTAMTAGELPKFTLVTPSYNQADFLNETMQSVLSQSGVVCDYIVMDGGSKDGSAEIIQSEQAKLLHWESKKDRGQSDAIARGFLHANSGPDDIYAYLNSDDILLPGTLRFVAEYFAKHPDVDMVYGHRVVINTDSKQTGLWLSPIHSPSLLRLVDLIPQETAFWRKRIYEKVGGIDPSFRFAMDWDLFLRFLGAGAKIRRLPYFLAGFRVHQDSKTVTQSQSIGWDECEKLRRRVHGDRDYRYDLRSRFQRAQIQGKFLHSLWERGIRV